MKLNDFKFCLSVANANAAGNKKTFRTHLFPHSLPYLQCMVIVLLSCITGKRTTYLHYNLIQLYLSALIKDWHHTHTHTHTRYCYLDSQNNIYIRGAFNKFPNFFCIDYLTKMGIKTVAQLPYSLDLAPCDFWLFPKLRGTIYQPLRSGRIWHKVNF